VAFCLVVLARMSTCDIFFRTGSVVSVYCLRVLYVRVVRSGRVGFVGHLYLLRCYISGRYFFVLIVVYNLYLVKYLSA
jgi:hypothetical protein